MSKVTHYLDCGCALLEDGSRAWCPTCANGGPKDNRDERIDALESQLEAIRAIADCIRGEGGELGVVSRRLDAALLTPAPDLSGPDGPIADSDEGYTILPGEEADRDFPQEE